MVTIPKEQTAYDGYPAARTQRTPSRALRHAKYVEQDQAFIRLLQRRHRPLLDTIREETAFNAGASVPVRRLWLRIERHLYPALEAREALSISDGEMVRYCEAFLLRFSMPVVLWDEWTDKASSRSETDVLNGAYLSFRGQVAIDALRSGRRISLALNDAYAHIVKSALEEEAMLFRIPSPRAAKTLITTSSSSRYYRSLCGYFSAIITGLLLLSGRRVSRSLREFLRLFGVLRQIADDIADVHEDLSRGLVTLPLLSCMDDDRIEKGIDEYWHRRRDFVSMKRLIIDAGGYERAYESGMKVFAQAERCADRLSGRSKFVLALMPFFELKRLLLLRLRDNNWDDAIRLS